MKFMDTKLFIEKAKKIHGDKYDYTKVEYINSKTHVIIICNKHKEFLQTPDNHLYNKCGCKKCGIIKRSNSNRGNKEEFIEDSNSINEFIATSIIYNQDHFIKHINF
jgi:hypothetical protein